MNKEYSDKLFCEIALKHDFVSKEQIKAALDAQKIDRAVGQTPEAIGKYLIELGALTEHQANSILQKIQKTDLYEEDTPVSNDDSERDLSSEQNEESTLSEDESVTLSEKNNGLPEPDTSAAEKNEIILPCPNCGKDSIQSYRNGVSSYHLVCNLCLRQFSALLAHVRSKKSRVANRTDYSPTSRNVEVRLRLLDGTEHFLQFHSLSDVELRSKDFVAFVFCDTTPLSSKIIGTLQRLNRPEILSPGEFAHVVWVKNFTINQSFQVQTLRSCYIATAIYGESSKEVAALRSFRDNILLPNPFLRQLVSLYYLLSRFLLRAYDNSILNLLIRCFICPFAYCYSRFYSKLCLKKQKRANRAV
ncbi:hypothetical protein MASR1M12_31530 [Erysipelotrichia bacterium]